MCGIIGIYGSQPITPSDREDVERGAEWMHLRGPDGRGHAEDSGVYFGHRRLAILDPELGQQPWVDSDTKAILVFNGEIYNFDELRQQLASSGFVFKTRCDTELLMCAYLKWGTDCLERLNGMFAFALYDPRKQSLWLARDRLGVKPLYYHFNHEQLRFASSLKAMFAFPAVERRLDMATAWHYLRTVRTSLGERTLIDSVKCLEPGQELWWSHQESRQITLNNYWSLNKIGRSKDTQIKSFEEACKESHQRVEEAVQRQMISDVPLGGFLSGGIDSSILSNVASKFSDRPIGTFSVGYDLKDYNEWDSIRENAAFNNLENHEILLNGNDYERDWEWLIAEKGMPLSTPNEVPIYRLSKSFGSRYKVALSGEGADEIFGGYIIPTFCAHDWDRMQQTGNCVKSAVIQQAYGTNQLGTRQEHFFRVNSWMRSKRLQEICHADFAPDPADDPVDNYYAGLFAELEDCSTMDAFLRVHARVNLEGLLSRLDTSTMAASVEGRVPYTDHTLIEWLFNQPDHYKMQIRKGLSDAEMRRMSVYDYDKTRNIDSKRLLRHAFSKQVPKRILNQPKVSFPVPFMNFFQNQWQTTYHSMLNSKHGPADFLTESTKSDLRKAKTVDALMAWPLVNLHLWQKKFNISFPS